MFSRQLHSDLTTVDQSQLHDSENWMVDFRRKTTGYEQTHTNSDPETTTTTTQQKNKTKTKKRKNPEDEDALDALKRVMEQEQREKQQQEQQVPGPINATQCNADEEPTPFYWKKDLNLMLIDLYKKHQDKFTSVRYKQKQVWLIISTEISDLMKKLGYDCTYPTFKQVETRWRTMVKTYKKTVDHNRQSGNDRKSCLFYNELDEILGKKPNVTPKVTYSSSGYGNSYNKKFLSEDASLDVDEGEIEDEDEEECETQQEFTSFTSTSSSSPTKKKRKYVSSSIQATNSILMWLQTYEEKKEAREKLKMERTERMHMEKMSIFERLLDKL